MLIKLGESVTISADDIQSPESIESNAEIWDRLQKTAASMKMIAPKANDFLYFSAVMMHGAEASLLDDDGKLRKDANGDDVKAFWEKDNNTWKWICSDSKIKPYKNNNCFVPGTKILMSDGSVKNIEEIEIGDEVITHKGRKRKVTQKFTNKYDGKLLSLDIRNNRHITVTPNHPFYTLFIENENNKNSPRKLLASNSSNKEFKFLEINNIDELGLLTCPIVESDYSNEFTPGQAKLLGYFAAEGCYSKKYDRDQGVRFTCGLLEKETIVADIANLFAQEFPDCSVKINKYADRGVCELTATGQKIAGFFRTNVGEYSEYKKLSNALVLNNNSEIKYNFILGWLEGDGCLEKGAGQLIGVTASANLSSQIRVMLNSMHIPHSLRWVEPKEGQTITINPNYPAYPVNGHYRIELNATYGAEFVKNSNRLKFIKRGKDRFTNHYLDNYFLTTLINKSEIDYSGYVYNFEVEEDHSYVANDIAVHNCDIFPSSELKIAYKKWVGKPLCVDHKSSEVDSVRGLILDTYWDEPKQRIIALCALDKKNYPELARKVATGYSTSVSMGVGVGKAICYDCGRVARAEQDFCNHMRTKSAYGEINVDLNPIELSIVVNGADPEARIKHVIAQADSIAQYVEKKQLDLNKLEKQAEDESKDIELATDIQNGLSELQDKITDMSKKIEQLRGNEESEQARFEKQQEETPAVATNSQEEMLKVAEKAINSALGRIQDFENRFRNYEEKMTTKQGYWQGGGGVNEPTPGKVKYEKEDEDSIRANQDKQMNGQGPFPNVGPVDKMYPGYESFGETEEARKKRLQRMAEEQDQRKIRREAAVEQAITKLNYWQGGGGANEPTPGKVKYPKEDYETARDKEDKQMNGQSPFPEVGKVDGLHPSPASVSEKDELKRKEMLGRASLKAQLFRSANSGESRWMVFAGNEQEGYKDLVISGSVKDIAAGNSARYDLVATPDFGRKILSTLKNEGYEKAADLMSGGLFKEAQSAPAMPAMPAPSGPVGANPVGDGALPPMGLPEMEEKPMDAGGTGDVSEELPDLLDKTESTLSEIRKGINTLMDKDDNKLEVTDGMSPTTASLIQMKEKLREPLLQGMKVAEAKLNQLSSEIHTANRIRENKKQLREGDAKFFYSMAAETVAETKTALADSKSLMKDFINYARGVEATVKRAAKESNSMKTAQFAPSNLPGDPLDPTLPGDSGATKAMPVHPSTPAKPVTPAPHIAPKKDELPVPYGDRSQLESMLINNTRRDQSGQPVGPGVHPGATQHADDGAEGCKEDTNDAIKVDTDGSMTADTPDEAGKAMKAMKAATKEEKAALRAKLAEKGMQLSSLLQKAHPKGGTDLENMGTGDCHVETPDEKHKAMLEAVQAPVKLRQAAEDIEKLVKAGVIDPEKDFPMLVANGLDSAAVSYWKKFLAQAPDGGSQFASELVKDVAKKKAAEENEAYRAKLTRAFEVAYDMTKKGMIGEDRAALRKQVDDLMKFNDDAFASMQRWVEKSASKKISSIPVVGRMESFSHDESTVSEDSFEAFKAELDAAFSTPRNRR